MITTQVTPYHLGIQRHLGVVPPDQHFSPLSTHRILHGVTTPAPGLWDLGLFIDRTRRFRRGIYSTLASQEATALPGLHSPSHLPRLARTLSHMAQPRAFSFRQPACTSEMGSWEKVYIIWACFSSLFGGVDSGAGAFFSRSAGGYPMSPDGSAVFVDILTPRAVGWLSVLYVCRYLYIVAYRTICLVPWWLCGCSGVRFVCWE